MPIGSDFSIDYVNDTIDYIGGFTNNKANSIYSVREFYQWLQDTFDEPAQMDEDVPMTAQTPNEYTLVNKWHIRERVTRALFGGSIQTDGWTRTPSTENGIVLVHYSGGTDPIESDIGLPVVHAPDGDSGVLLDFDTTRQVLWIRPDDDTPGNNFDSTSGTISVSGGTGSVTQDMASETGETVWHNIFSLGTIEAQTEIYVIQSDDFFEVASPTQTKLSAWWDEDVYFLDPTGSGGAAVGHVDLLVKIKEVDTLIDSGRLVVAVRQYTKGYDFFQTQPQGSGRSPIPFSTGDDIDNTTGYRRLRSSAASGTWSSSDVGVVIREAADTDNTAVITYVSGTTPNYYVHYYLIGTLGGYLAGDLLETEAQDRSLTIDGSGTYATGPAEDTDITLTFGHDESLDVNDDGTNENYSVVINANNHPLTEVWEFLKFETRRGADYDIDDGSQTVIGEFYVLIGETLFVYDAEGAAGPPNQGEEVINTSGTFSGIVTSVDDNGTSGTVVVRNVVGSLVDNDTVRALATGSRSVVVAGTPTTVTPVKVCPFGSFAGGKFFGARGVGMYNVPAADAQNYQLISTQGAQVVPPNIVGVTFGNVAQYDRVAMFRLVASGGAIVKDAYTSATGTNVVGDTDLVVTATISKEYPRGSTGSVGYLRVVDNLDEAEQRYGYSNFAGATFSLFPTPTGSITTPDAAGETLIDSAANFIGIGVKVGMEVRNATDGSEATILSVDSGQQLSTTPLTGGGDNEYQAADVYTVNRLTRTYDGSDTVYVALMDEEVESGTEVTKQITFSANFYVTARMRRGSQGVANKVQPFVTEGQVISGGLTVTAIRTPDTIAT